MLCAADRPVGGIPLFCKELLRVYLTEKLLAEEAGDKTHIRGDSRVARVKPRVAAAGVREAEGQPHAGEVRVHGLYLAGEKVYVHGSAQCAGELIHKSAGLAEMQVFRLLRGFCDSRCLELRVVVQLIERAHHEHGEGRRGAEPRAGAELAVHHGVEAAAARTKIEHRRGRAPHESRRGAELLRMHVQIKEVYFHVVKAIGSYAHYVVEIGLYLRVDALIHRRGKHPALLMVGVVAGKLGPARRKHFFHIAALFLRA